MDMIAMGPADVKEKNKTYSIYNIQYMAINAYQPMMSLCSKIKLFLNTRVNGGYLKDSIVEGSS